MVNDSKIKQWYKVTRKFWVALITVGIFASAYRGSTLTAEGAERLGGYSMVWFMIELVANWKIRPD